MSSVTHHTAASPADPTGPASPAGPADGTGAARRRDPRWARPALGGLLLGTALLYLVDLSSSGWANAFYSAAVQAGSRSWKAFFFGSSDAANFITVDKPPAFLWPMELSVRLFGLNSWAMLVPQALMGVAAVGVLYAAVRRRFGVPAGLIAGGVLALTPVAVLMFRFNNPDALLALLMVLALYATQRALEQGRTRWVVAVGALIGAAFLVKTLQAFLIVPVLAFAYLALAPVRLRRRLGQLALATAAMVVAGGWWVAIVQLWPASSRPYVGGSQHNSFLELTFGYNGFGRIDGNETGSVGGGRGGGGGFGGGMWGSTGLGRLFGSEIGGQISWLLPAALILLVAGLVATRRAPRVDERRQALVLWGGSLLITAAVFSYMAGIFHPYYTVALAPYIAAVVGMGAALLWERRSGVAASVTLALAVAVTAVWSHVLLARSPHWYPWLGWLVLVVGLPAAACLALGPLLGRVRRRPGGATAGPTSAGRGRHALAVAAAGAGLLAVLSGPAAYAVDTAATGHTGSLPTAGPATAGGGMFPGGGPGGGRGRRGGAPAGMPGRVPGGGRGGTAAGLPPGGFPAGGPGGGGGGGGFPRAGGFPGRAGGARAGGFPGGAGGASQLLDGSRVSTAMKRLLRKDASRYTWVAAAIGSQNQASYQLATGDPVMSIGGFNGTDPAPSLAAFEAYVKQGRIHYFIAGGGMGAGMGGSGDASQISSWVESHFTATTVGGTTVYDLTRPRSTT